MNCLALSFATLQYDWNKHNGILPQTAVKSYNHNFLSIALSEKPTSVNNLAVHNVQPSDEGWYCCVATNEGGSRTDCAWLKVNSKLYYVHTPYINDTGYFLLNLSHLSTSIPLGIRKCL